MCENILKIAGETLNFINHGVLITVMFKKKIYIYTKYRLCIIILMVFISSRN